jgi:hypothetical protein
MRETQPPCRVRVEEADLEGLHVLESPELWSSLHKKERELCW